jgi:hypothetical protein
MKPFTITIEVNEALLEEILNKREYNWATVEEKLANRAMDSAVLDVKTRAFWEFISTYSYNKEVFNDLAKKQIEEKLWESINNYLETLIEKKWWESQLEKRIETILRNTMESKLTEYTQNILSNLMVVSTEQENNQ